jgi:hypothetical protein
MSDIFTIGLTSFILSIIVSILLLTDYRNVSRIKLFFFNYIIVSTLLTIWMIFSSLATSGNAVNSQMQFNGEAYIYQLLIWLRNCFFAFIIVAPFISKK